jgi:hypothetical protein
MKIIMPCGLVIENEYWSSINIPMQICRECENLDCDVRMSSPKPLIKLVEKKEEG